MTYRNAPARPAGRTFSAIAKTTVKTAALTLAFAAAAGSLALAQAPKKPPVKQPAPAPAQAHPAQPAQPAAPAPAPQQAEQQQQVQLIYSPWTKFCLTGQEAGGSKVCFTGKDARIESGMLVASAAFVIWTVWLLPALSIVPAAGLYVKLPATGEEAFSWAGPSGVP